MDGASKDEPPARSGDLPGRAIELVARIDPQLRYLYVHPSTARITGIPSSEFVGREMGSVSPQSEHFARWRSAVEDVARTGREALLAIEVPRADGSIGHVQVLILPEIETDGTVRQICAFVRDTTEEKRLERQVERQRRRLERQLHELECLHRIAGVLHGHPGDPQEVLSEVAQMLAGAVEHPELAGASLQVQGRTYSSSGFSPEHVTISVPIWSDGGRTLGTIEVSSTAGEPPSEDDVRLIETIASHVGAALRRAEAERALAQREAYFRALIETSGDVVTVSDPGGRWLYFSPAFRELTGYDPEDKLDSPSEELVHPDDVERARESFHRVQREGLGRVEIRFRHRSGSYRHVEVLARDLTSDPNVRGIVSSLRDVTERRTLETQLRQAQKMEAVGRLAGGVAHDFNNLLTVIQANAELLLDDMPSGAAAREEVDQIMEAAKRAETLTRQLLAFSRREVVQPQVVDLREVVVGMQKMLGRLIGEDVSLETDVAPEPCLVLADPGGLEQVILNLAINARDAMPKGGRLGIWCGLVEPGLVRLAVSDAGEGMDEHLLERVFDPFFTTKQHGTGLGLSTVYGIVRQARGAIRVESAPGAGTTFTIDLPRAASRNARLRSKVAVTAVVGGTEKILVVEDEESVRRLVGEVLRRLGYDVIVAPDGPTALQVAREHPRIDLLLTDVVMPQMSGRELAEQLTAERGGDLRVLFMSGHTDDARLRHGLREQRVRMLHKPFTGTDLGREVRDVLDSARMAAEE